MHVLNVLHAARWKHRTQKLRKKSSSVLHSTMLSAYISSQLRHVSTIRKKLLNSNISSTCPHNMVNFGPLTVEIGWRVWGTPANFNGFRVLASLLHRRRSTEVNQTLHCVWPSPGRYAIYTLSGSLASWRNFSTCKIHFVSIYAPSHKFLGLYLRN